MPPKNSGIFRGSVTAVAMIFGMAADLATAQESKPEERFRQSIPYPPDKVARIAGQYQKYAKTAEEKELADRLNTAANVLNQGIERCAGMIAAAEKSEGDTSAQAIYIRNEAAICPERWRDMSRMVKLRIPRESQALMLP
jgi:hypothetical protein